MLPAPSAIRTTAGGSHSLSRTATALGSRPVNLRRLHLLGVVGNSSTGAGPNSLSGRHWGSMSQFTQVCQGYVGESTPPAGQYHCTDFEWEELRLEAEFLLATRAAGNPSASASDGNSDLQAAAGDPFEHTAESWENFHATHSSARFFKEKRYLLLEFPVLADTGKPQHVLEIGCGCGSSLLPILKANPKVKVTACDVSPTAVDLFQEAVSSAGIDPTSRIHRAFAADLTTELGGEAVASTSADCCLLIFTLSAVMPGDMGRMLRAALCALRPGGLLLFRDYALYDMPQLRFPESQRLEDRLYRRLDGTLSYFFTTEDISARAETVGFEVVESSYACTIIRNRRKGRDMKRAFVHGVFRRPLDPQRAEASTGFPGH